MTTTPAHPLHVNAPETTAGSLLDAIETLTADLRRHGLQEVHLTQNSETLTLRLARISSRPDTPHPARSPAEPVRSPEMGIFRHAPDLHVPDLNTAPRVASGAPLGFIEIGPVRLAVRAPCNGTPGPAMAQDGAPVGYGDILFMFEAC